MISITEESSGCDYEPLDSHPGKFARWNRPLTYRAEFVVEGLTEGDREKPAGRGPGVPKSTSSHGVLLMIARVGGSSTKAPGHVVLPDALPGLSPRHSLLFRRRPWAR